MIIQRRSQRRKQRKQRKNSPAGDKIESEEEKHYQQEANEMESLSINVDLFATALKRELELIETNQISTSATDGKQILVNVKNNQVAKNIDELHSLLKHEYAHILFQSNLETVNLVAAQYPKVPKHIIAEAYNIIEDYRIEKNWENLYPSSVKDFDKLKQNIIEDARKNLKKTNENANNPLTALFAARLGDDAILKGAPKEIAETYPIFVKEFKKLDNKGFAASYPVLRDAIGIMEKWIDEEKEKVAKGMPKSGNGNNQGTTGSGGIDIGTGVTGGGGGGTKGGTMIKGKSGSGSGSSSKNNKQNSGGSGGGAGSGTDSDKDKNNQNANGSGQQPSVTAFDELSVSEQKAIIDNIINSIASQLERIDSKLHDELSHEEQPSPEEIKDMKKAVNNKSDSEINKKAEEDHEKEVRKAIDILEALQRINDSPIARKKAIYNAREHKISKIAQSINDVSPKSLAHSAPYTSKNMASPIIRKAIQDIFHTSRLNSSTSGRKINYNKLIKKIISPEKDISVFNKKQIHAGGEYWFLLDLSGSMIEGDKLPLLKQVILTLYDSVVPFNKDIKFRIFGYTTGKIAELTRNDILTASDNGGTPTGEALANLWSKMKKSQSNNNKTVFIITDGVPDNEFLPNTVLAFLKAQNIPVFTILVGGGANNKYTKSLYSESKAVYGVDDMAATKPILERIIIKDIAKKLKV